jgi:hypothetical protein
MPDYKDPRDEKMENGRSVADYMRRGPAGLRGVVVAKATAGGTPENFNPHDISNVRVNVINPDGASVQSLALSQITGETMRLAQEAARERVKGADINSIRERTAVVFEELAKMSSGGVKRVPTKQAVTRRPAVVEPVEPSEEELIAELEEAAAPSWPPNAPPVEQIDRSYSPMAAFGLKKSTGVAQSMAEAINTNIKAAAPQKLVYFEKEGLGTVPAFYHDIIVNVTREDPDNYEYTGFIVLVYDLRFEQNAARWFPPANDPYRRPWAALIKGDQRLYLVHTTGFQYVYDNREYCVLSVEKAVLAPAAET